MNMISLIKREVLMINNARNFMFLFNQGMMSACGNQLHSLASWHSAFLSCCGGLFMNSQEMLFLRSCGRGCTKEGGGEA